MKKICLLLFLCLVLAFPARSQQVNGLIMADTGNLMVIKLWGSHSERGYAYGFLAGDQMAVLMQQYLKPLFGTSYGSAKALLVSGNDLSIDSIYVAEAQAIISGMTAAGYNTGNYDYLDILVANSLLDVMELLDKKGNMGCSSLMSWGDATAGTSLDGKAAISRQLDWQINGNLINNQVMVVHLPSEPDEQPWAMVGFAGMFTALSGFNEYFGVFQHVMDDFSGSPLHNQHYTPMWFALREVLEKKDFNNDGYNNVQDVKQGLSDQTHGFPSACIISALARSTELTDSLIAMVAELAPMNPTHTFRYNDFNDSIPGDNLYTANYQIKRNNMIHLCARYNAMISHIGNGMNIGLDANWQLLRDWSHLSNNLQLMQYCPEEDLFRISCHYGGQLAYLNAPVTYSIQDLFSNPVSAGEIRVDQPEIVLFPVPSAGRVSIRGLKPGLLYCLNLQDITGKTIFKTLLPGVGQIQCLELPSLKRGIYYAVFTSHEGIQTCKLLLGE